jgi:hypothetical protein
LREVRLQVVLGALPRKTEDDEVTALVLLHALGFSHRILQAFLSLSLVFSWKWNLILVRHLVFRQFQN